MSFEVSVLVQTPPVLLLDIEGGVTPADMASHLDALEAAITKQGWLETTIYLIVDVIDSDMSFIDVVKGAATHATSRRGSSSDPLTEAAFVGAKPMIKLLRDMLRKQNPGANFMLLFETREAALSYFTERDRTKGLLDHKGE